MVAIGTKAIIDNVVERTITSPDASDVSKTVSALFLRFRSALQTLCENRSPFYPSYGATRSQDARSLELIGGGLGANSGIGETTRER